VKLLIHRTQTVYVIRIRIKGLLLSTEARTGNRRACGVFENVVSPYIISSNEETRYTSCQRNHASNVISRLHERERQRCKGIGLARPWARRQSCVALCGVHEKCKPINRIGV
jgi:hypothetical protein